jgi:hypothetical protein
MREISTEEGDAIIRASWPARRQDIDYAQHTSECADCDDDDDARSPQFWDSTLSILVRVVAVVGLLAVLVIFWPKS